MSLTVYADNHACNMPGCACGVMERVEEDRRMERMLPGWHAAKLHRDPPGPLSRAQQWLWDRGWTIVGNWLSDARYWLWRLCR